MNFKTLMLAGLAMSMLAACSQNDELANGTGEGGDVYMSLSIEMPNTGMSSRVIDESGEKNEGTTEEQKVTNLLLLVYQENGTLECNELFSADHLTPNAPKADVNKATTYTLKEPVSVTTGKKKVVVIVNPSEKFKNGVALTKMREMETLEADDVKAISTNNKFMMTNANPTANQDNNGTDLTKEKNPMNDGDFYLDGSVALEVTGSHTKENPASVTIPVERVVAKIEDVTTTYEITVKEGNKVESPTAIGNPGDIVTFNKVALINGNKKFYPIKKIRQQGDNTNDYVVDPNFVDQTENTKNDFYANTFNAASFENTNDLIKDLKTDNRAVFYTLENTMIKDEQKNGYTTGLYYQATYQLKDGKKGDNIYSYGGNLYTFDQLKGAAKSLGINWNESWADETTGIDDFAKVGIKKYEKGICYYTYWIRHIDNGENKIMGPMEFAVVRNNWYKMEINSVKGIGENVPTNPDPETPDETVDSYLNIQVKVLPWVVRNNLIDF